ncbi:hypothetical protein C9Z87_26240 (plasmid) [Escherichia coli]|uniref:hypothetical protein n=1 Tax=Escherichia coli TaxID=562 RepID=UPI0008FFD2D9|nr:hypothetical protein [Escherichia coli]EEQ8528507.1 hypothetical protein [Escherichia coli]EER7297305.1 hypothetical protein [Escherichia coli]EEU5496357.1 hypothetical protein [Escherichia coli]EEX9993506.1 hypothetical protein [Escherichia coli]EEY3616484.1 hypothetical protein [Escherichia coli]
MILSVFITVISGHDKPQPPGCLLGKANKIASECRKRNEMAEARRVRENERNKIREKQLQALNDAHSAKER